MWIHLLATRLIDGAGGGVAPEPETPGYSGEVELRPVYIRRGKKIHLFANNAQADAFLEAEEQAQEAIERAKSKQARRKARRKARVYEFVEHKTVDIDLLGELAQRYSMPVDIPALVQDESWAELAKIAIRALQIQEDEDVGAILESEQQEYFENLARIGALVQAGAFKSLAAEVRSKPPVVKTPKVDKKAKQMANMTESLGATMAVVMKAIEKMNQPKTVIRDEAGKIKGIA